MKEKDDEKIKEFDKDFLERIDRIFENLMKLNDLMDKAESRSKIILNNEGAQR